MANRYEATFASLKKSGRKAFIPYTMLGFPDIETSFQSIKTMVEHGAAALELGLAFSDPLADGPVIQQAAAETIESGFKTKDAFEIIARVRALDKEIPITLMCYYNSVLAPGHEKFCQRASEAGVDGLLIVDLPPEQSAGLSDICRSNKLVQIFIISPLTSTDRMSTISKQAGGFLYAVSRLGTTGVEARYDEHLADLIKRAGAQVRVPVVVGFGVSTPEQALQMYEIGADGVITGSRIIELIRDEKSGKEKPGALAEYISRMSESDQKVRA